MDCTLPEQHPYRQACGLRPGSAASLVSLSFVSHPASHHHPRVPSGFAFYTLEAKLNELQLVFLYRFLQENLQYITTLLAMRPPAAAAGEETTTSIPTPQQQSSRTITLPPPSSPTNQPQQPQQPQQQQPFVLAIEVEMNAPVISMPRNSHSLDAIDVDLGSLKLTTSVESTEIDGGGDGMSSSTGIQDEKENKVAALASSLVEVAELTFSGVGCTVVQAGRRGNSVVKNPEQGWQLGWRRPLLPLERGEAPYVSFWLVYVFMPFISTMMTRAVVSIVVKILVDD